MNLGKELFLTKRGARIKNHAHETEKARVVLVRINLSLHTSNHIATNHVLFTLTKGASKSNKKSKNSKKKRKKMPGSTTSLNSTGSTSSYRSCHNDEDEWDNFDAKAILKLFPNTGHYRNNGIYTVYSPGTTTMNNK